MTTKPSVFPQWAMNTDGTDNDVIDSTSGVNNVVEPDASKKLVGWGYQEAPPRQFMNWIHRITGQWIRWFDQSIDPIVAAGTFSVTFNICSVTATIHYQKFASGLIRLWWNDINLLNSYPFHDTAGTPVASVAAGALVPADDTIVSDVFGIGVVPSYIGIGSTGTFMIESLDEVTNVTAIYGGVGIYHV
jgi:hypothetical protein